MEQDKIRRYGFISTGNFNESTAKVYTDVTLFKSSANSERHYENL
jgi:polyphosphate kinase